MHFFKEPPPSAPPVLGDPIPTNERNQAVWAAAAANAADFEDRGEWDERLRKLWEACEGANESYTPSGMARVTTKDIQGFADTFYHGPDVLPRHGGVIDHKAIHSAGAVGLFEWRSESSRWSGILEKGGCAIGRFSNGGSGGDAPFQPGFALKFPVTDGRSAHALFGAPFDGSAKVEGWQSLLAVHQRTWLGPLQDDRTQDLLFRTFGGVRQASGCTSNTHQHHAAITLSVDELAVVDQEGNPCEPRVPFGIELSPTPEARKAWADAVASVEEGTTPTLAFLEALGALPSGLELYEIRVCAKAPGEAPQLERIGTLVLVSELIVSNFGDSKLFFRHPAGCP